MNLLILSLLISMPWVSVEVKVTSHHGNNENMKLELIKNGKKVDLIVDGFKLPETRVLTNRQDLDTIINFRDNSNNLQCGRDSFSYVKISEGKTERFSGCPTSKNFQLVRKAFQNISAIR
jgi:hypothetical protein